MELIQDAVALAAAVGAAGKGNAFQLVAGVHHVTATIVVERADVTITGHCKRTVLKRGKLPDGSLFAGTLLSIAGASGVQLRNLEVDGSRFESTADGTLDHRHPLTADRAAPQFTCASRLPEPDCYDPVHFGSSIEAEILITQASDILLASIAVHNCVTIGVAVGPGSSRIRLERLDVAWAGQMGIWVGGAFHQREPLPLTPELEARLPRGVVISQTRVSHSGASGVFVEGRDIAVEHTRFVGNHCDFPFDETGGQLVIDYKTDHMRVESCVFEGKSFVQRRVARLDAASGRLVHEHRRLGAVAIEASGSHLKFIDTVVTGSAREALHINGARHVVVEGGRTHFAGNHRAARHFFPLRFLLRPREAVQNISITTTSEMAHLGAMAGDIRVSGVRCEDGITVWSDGSVPGLRVDGLRVEASNLAGCRRRGGVAVGINADGSSVQGAGWLVMAA